jgi:hypothetical protein
MDLTNVDIYLRPAICQCMDGSKIIVGCKPNLPYTEDLYQAVVAEFEKRQANKRPQEMTPKVPNFKKSIPSSKDPTKTYTVVSIDNKIICDCPGFTYRGKCRHVDQVLAETKP